MKKTTKATQQQNAPASPKAAEKDIPMRLRVNHQDLRSASPLSSRRMFVDQCKTNIRLFNVASNKA